jgi:hypothetical protein
LFKSDLGYSRTAGKSRSWFPWRRHVDGFGEYFFGSAAGGKLHKRRDVVFFLQVSASVTMGTLCPSLSPPGEVLQRVPLRIWGVGLTLKPNTYMMQEATL